LLRYITSPNFPDHLFPSDFAEFKLDNGKDKPPKGLWDSTEALTSIDTTNYGLSFPPTPGITNDKTMVVRAFTSSSLTGDRMLHLELDIGNNGEVIKYKDKRNGSVVKLRVRIEVSWKVDPRLPHSGAAMSQADIKKLVKDRVVVTFNEFAELTGPHSSNAIMNSTALKERYLRSSALGLGTLTVQVPLEDST
jgi:hypothetical protein